MAERDIEDMRPRRREMRREKENDYERTSGGRKKAESYFALFERQEIKKEIELWKRGQEIEKEIELRREKKVKERD